MHTLQAVLSALTDFWTSRGALLGQPFNTEVGAGTANPNTTLRVLGPEPWTTAYVEPSVRPDDSRYGKNPNRLQTHTQFQVILKPDPGNPQELYLQSLQAIGIDLGAHDVRFVEDNWASPALGAWGLGWEVWLDGQEITQFTYFQQAGSLTLDPVSVEITYGIERIVMALQGVNHFKDIEYAPGISYGEVFGQAEYEMSRYYLDEASVPATSALYDLHVAEAERLLELGLPVPAYYQILKCSHTFNVLDARGAVSTAERARSFGTMRRLSKNVAELWVARREELGFPLGVVAAPVAPQPLPTPEPTDAPATLLFEIGVEELPVAEVTRAQRWLESTVTERLAATGLGFGAVRTYSTPRRLIVTVDGVDPREQDVEQVVRGPKVAAAFGDDGQPTRAASGFAGKHGVEVAELQRVTHDGAEHVAVVKDVVGRTAVAVLSPLLAQVVLDLRADRNMRWSDPQLTYARAIRWLLAVLGDRPVPVTVSALTSGTVTRVHRLAAQPEIEVTRADGYADLLLTHGIVADRDERHRMIVDAAHEFAGRVGGRIDLDLDGDVVEEVVDLVELPVPVLGSFEEHYLELPPEILIAVMRKHQRYLPVRDAEGRLLAHFVTFANGECDTDVVAAGNAAVVRARFEDASFFWSADREVEPAELRRRLSRLTFETTLGSMAQRSERIAAGALALAGSLALADDDLAVVRSAGELAKFDLASQMVIEMTSLAGTMAGYYARHAGSPEAVAVALEDMELPRTSDQGVATTLPGAVLAVADRADQLTGLFVAGANPTGSSDPFALRRAALGLVATLRGWPALAAVAVSDVLGLAADAIRAQGIEVPAEAVERAAVFVGGRYEQSLLDAGHDVDLVSAVRPLTDRPYRAAAALDELETLRASAGFRALVELVSRITRLVGDAASATTAQRPTSPVPSEASVLAALEGATAAIGVQPSVQDVVAATAGLVGATQAMLDSVQIMDPDEDVRAARIGLLASVVELASRTGVDWTALARAIKR